METLLFINMFINFELISGVCFGIQFITKNDVGELDDGWYILIELGIIRIILEK